MAKNSEKKSAKPKAGGKTDTSLGSYLEGTGFKDVTLETLRRVEHRQRVVVYASWAMTGIAALALFLFVAMGQSGFAFGSICLCAVILLVAMGIDRSTTVRDITSSPVSPDRSTVIISRPIPALPPADGEFKQLANKLEGVRNAAFIWISNRRDDIVFKPGDIRANVFLFDYVSPGKDRLFTLFMPDEWKVNMQGHPDEEIRFRPGQGLTGKVFLDQSDLNFAMTFLNADGKEEFEEFYELTEKQKRDLHPALRWIVSFALTIPVGSGRKAAGVLNVDGLHHQVTPDDLKLLWGALSDDVRGFADGLSLLPRVRLTVLTEPETR